MSDIDFEIIASGSAGNAVIINREILIDCGVPFKALEPYYRDLKIVLLTHIHSDHFNPATIKRLAELRPTLLFFCCDWLLSDLARILDYDKQIVVSEFDKILKLFPYGRGYKYIVKPFPLVHDVPNCGWKIFTLRGKIIYATDTNSLDGISAPNYDLYLIEANYEDEEIRQRIKEKAANGEYVFERRVLQTHLSKAKADDFIYSNIGANGKFVYMHQHEERKKNEQDNCNGENNP